MRTVESIIKAGDCGGVLLDYSDNYFDLIVTSPPYAECRKKTYGNQTKRVCGMVFAEERSISASSEAP